MPLPINLLTLTIKIHQLDLKQLKTLKMHSITRDWLFLFKGQCHRTLTQMLSLTIELPPRGESRSLMRK